jgi:hypothetical protein
LLGCFTATVTTSTSVACLGPWAFTLTFFVNSGEEWVGGQETVTCHQATTARNAGCQTRICGQIYATRAIREAPAEANSVYTPCADVESGCIHNNGHHIWQHPDRHFSPDIATHWSLHSARLARIAGWYFTGPISRLWVGSILPRHAAAVYLVSRANVSQGRVQHGTWPRGLWVLVARWIHRWQWRNGSLLARDGHGVAPQQRFVEA